MKRSVAIAVWWVAALAMALPAAANDASEGTKLASISLEELMDYEITSVSKKGERLFEASAAVFVITNEDIQRYGATTIPEALRLAPGLQVARIDGNKWAVTARGFNGRFANKLLVLIDGRSVYTPLFSGTFWEVQDVMLEDVDRIEVIRGPGAALWGANAVNGIINIITKPSGDTQGQLLVVGSGTTESALLSFRTGGTLGDAGHYRAYAKYNDRDALERTTGGSADDASKALRVGFRTDWDVTDSDRLTVQGDYYDGETGQTYTLVDSVVPPFTSTFGFDVDVSGGNALARWTRTWSETAELAVQGYFDRTEREDWNMSETRNTIDLDVQAHRTLGRHAIVTGLGYRRTTGDLETGFQVSADPQRRVDDLFNIFVHDDLTVRPQELRLTLGAKIEHNDITGFEFQPSVRLLWTPNGNHAVWAAASRAVRTPSRGETDARLVLDGLPAGTVFPGAPTALVVFDGDSTFDSEDLHAFEAGYRFTPGPRLSFDLASFYNNYDSLISIEPDTPFLEPLPAPPHLVVPLRPRNLTSGKTYGAEFVVDWQPARNWRLHADLTLLHLHLELDPASVATSIVDAGESPDYQWFIRSSADLTDDLRLDLSVRHVDELPSPGVDSYTVVDGRFAWQATPSIEIELVGRNLADSDHVEFIPTFFPDVEPTVASRGFYAAVNWSF